MCRLCRFESWADQVGTGLGWQSAAPIIDLQLVWMLRHARRGGATRAPIGWWFVAPPGQGLAIKAGSPASADHDYLEWC